MKKAVLLILSSMILASSVPVFATNQPHTTNNQTVVGYTIGGTVVDPEGRIMVEIPKNVTLIQKAKEESLSVKAKVWNADAGAWVDPVRPNQTNPMPMGDEVKVFVKSSSAVTSGNDQHRGFKLRRMGDSGSQITDGEGAYEFKIGTTTINSETQYSSVSGSDPTKGFFVGKLGDGSSPNYTDHKYVLDCKVKMTHEPLVGQNEIGIDFYDTLNFTFEHIDWTR